MRNHVGVHLFVAGMIAVFLAASTGGEQHRPGIICLV
jgi:hypothetical protein